MIQGNEKIPFWSKITKPWTESSAERNCDDNQTGIVCKKVVLVKLVSGFQSFRAKSWKVSQKLLSR